MKESFQVKDLKGFLQGVWRLKRRIDDRRAAQQGRLDGTARFEAEAEGLLYREEGRLVIGSHDGPALQSYRYTFPTAQRAQVRFADGRDFHELDLGKGAWACTHLCGEDRYIGDFSLLGPDAWRVVWQVGGPRKDLVLDSSYRRAL